MNKLKIPFLSIRETAKRIGISEKRILSLGTEGKVKLCVLLGGDSRNEKAYFFRFGSDEKLEDFEKAFPGSNFEALKRLRVFDNGFAKLTFNPEPETEVLPQAVVNGLFELEVGTIENIQKVKDVEMVMVKPYKANMIIRLRSDFFGDDPVSKLFIPAEELDKMIEMEKR